jgi:hypothetical protein
LAEDKSSTSGINGTGISPKEGEATPGPSSKPFFDDDESDIGE